ncbi:hypothetical protein TUM4249_10060 [Shewanella sp. KT0246]|nr:hypothetical protein TUM4249_10060 [Shewanella sp. KT0246]
MEQNNIFGDEIVEPSDVSSDQLEVIRNTPIRNAWVYLLDGHKVGASAEIHRGIHQPQPSET